jgi:proline iminopeptidase
MLMTKPLEFIPFYPQMTANEEYRLKVSGIHEIYFASYGNKAGIPIVVLHGGPGAGTSPYYAQFFDPDLYHIILVDQRGAGKSTPKGEMRENTTQDLIADMETIRQHLNIEQWAVFGGSWGSSLALLYAEAHPERVLGLILRGIFLVRNDDISAFVRDGSMAAQVHPEEWKKFKEDLSKLLEAAGIRDISVQTHTIYHIIYRLLNQPNQDIREDAAGTISAWEKFNSHLIPDPADQEWSRSEDGVNMGVTEATYFEFLCYIRHNQILEDIARIAGIPVYIVQGIYDLVCPRYMSVELHKALLRVSAPDLITVKDVLGGHSHLDDAVRDGLIRSQRELAQRLLANN